MNAMELQLWLDGAILVVVIVVVGVVMGGIIAEHSLTSGGKRKDRP